jgi:hypothetical protein
MLCHCKDATVKDDKNSAQGKEKEEDSQSEEQTIFSDLTNLKKSCQFTSASTHKRMESSALQVTLNVDVQQLQIFWFRRFGSGCSGLNFFLTVSPFAKFQASHFDFSFHYPLCVILNRAFECLSLLLVEFGKALQAEKKRIPRRDKYTRMVIHARHRE